MIEEIKDFGSDIKDAIGDKGFYILIIGAIAFGLYNLLKSDDVEEYVSATGYASYPDVGENATQVIDELSQEIWAHNDEVLGAIQTSESEVIQEIQGVSDTVEATNNYVQEGLEKQQVIYETVQAPQQTQLDYLSYVYSDAKNVVENNTVQLQKVSSQLDNMTSTYNQAKTNASQATTNLKKVTSTSSKTSTAKTSTAKKSTASKTSTAKTSTPKTSTAKTSTTKTSTAKTSTAKTSTTKNSTASKTSTSSKSGSNTYTYKTASGLNTSTSIVDALKATGANSSYSARKEIATANGIKNYSGTASQNTQLLNKLKSGTLKKS